MIPKLDGIEVCKQVRAVAPIPIVMVTARGDEPDRINGLELGADDYVVKPFSPRELTARVKGVLRRARGERSNGSSSHMSVIRHRELEINLLSHEVFKQSQLVTLTEREFALLAWFVTHPQQAVRREQLLEEVWGYDCGDTATITVHVRRLREKIEDDPSEPTRITTVWGYGYRYVQ